MNKRRQLRPGVLSPEQLGALTMALLERVNHALEALVESNRSLAKAVEHLARGKAP